MLLGCSRKLGSMVSKWVITYNLLITGVFLGGITPLLLTFDPNFRGHPSREPHGLEHNEHPRLEQSLQGKLDIPQFDQMADLVQTLQVTGIVDHDVLVVFFFVSETCGC